MPVRCKAVLDPETGEISDSRFAPMPEELEHWAMQWQGKLGAVAIEAIRLSAPANLRSRVAYWSNAGCGGGGFRGNPTATTTSPLGARRGQIGKCRLLAERRRRLRGRHLSANVGAGKAQSCAASYLPLSLGGEMRLGWLRLCAESAFVDLALGSSPFDFNE